MNETKFKVPGLVVGLVIGVLFTATITYAYYVSIYKPSLKTVPPVAIVSPPVATPTTVTSQTGQYGQITWNAAPVKISNPDFLIKSPDLYYSFEDTQGTYEVGKFSSGATLLVAFIRQEGPGAAIPFRFIKVGSQYNLIESLITDKYIINDLPKIFDSSKVKIIAYDTLNLLPPDYLDAGSNNVFHVISGNISKNFFSELKNPLKMATTAFGDIYAEYSQSYDNNTQIIARELYLKLADSTLLLAKPNLSFYFDDKIPQVSLASVPNKEAFEPGIPYGCGLGGANTIIKNNSPLLSEKVEAGMVSSTSEKIYKITNPQSPLIQFLYNNYKLGRDYPSAPPYLPLDKYLTTNSHFLYQDKLGDWIVFVNSTYAPMVECGKPVVYLYPSKDTQVSVKVGADVTKSEPKYPESGWSVLAHPNGQLDYQGLSYPNLFWEGTGQGTYNAHSGEGFVVAQKDLTKTLVSQLHQQGLNDTETKDFLDFWLPKMPSTPYVRLTWLNTADMNRLAPLTVSPRPKTAIRLFLDFAGLDSPVTLKPQKLSAPPRIGFTLIEWGGLLVNKSQF